jgi:hypothetical protein
MICGQIDDRGYSLGASLNHSRRMDWKTCKHKLLETFAASLLLMSLCPVAYAQEADMGTGCTVHGFFHQTWSETSQFGQGLKAAPRGAVRPSNLKWELPISAATGVMIAKVDRPADNRIQSKSFQQTAGQWSKAHGNGSGWHR